MDVEQVSKMRRDVARLSAQVHDLRLALLRLSAIVAIALIGVGLVLPAWREEIDGEPTTARVLTAAMSPADEFGGFDTAARIGFVGLLLVLVLLCGVLVNSVMAGNGRTAGVGVRGVIETLAVVGSVVAALFSFIAAVTDVPDASGGIGPVVLLAGVIVAVVVLRYQPWQDLWIDQSGHR